MRIDNFHLGGVLSQEKITAEELAEKMREVSVAEFFEKNRHLLGYENPTKSLLTIVKEGVDNSVEWSEPVILKHRGTVRLVKIGEFVDEFFDTAPQGTELQSAPIGECEVLAYDDKTYKMVWKRTSKVHRHKLNDRLFEIELVEGRKVTVTGSHSVFALKDGRIAAHAVKDLEVGDNIVVPRKEFNIEGELKELDIRQCIKALPQKTRDKLMIRGVAKDLPVHKDYKRFDYVPYSYFEKNNIQIPQHARISVRNGRSSIPAVLKITSQFMRLLGYYAAEGTCYDRWITLSFGVHELDLIEDAEECLHSLGQHINFSRVFAHDTAITIKVHSQIVSILFNDILQTGCKADSKRVPDIVWNVSQELRNEFIRGYIAGDGYVRYGRVVVATISKELALGLQYLIGLSGTPYSTSTRKVREQRFYNQYVSQCKEVHYIYIYQSNRHDRSPLSRIPLEESGIRNLFAETCQLLSYTAHRRYDYKNHNSFVMEDLLQDIGVIASRTKGGLLHQAIGIKQLLEGDIGFLQIKSIREVVSEHPYVYDFSVPNFEKFLGGRGPIFLHNSLDACEEARILPEIKVVVKQVSEDRFRVSMSDNGPGIVEQKITSAFGKLLYGSKFHRLKEFRGTQGLGISGAILYSQLTTGKPAKIFSSTGKEVHAIELMIDVAKNEPHIISYSAEKNPSKWHGVKIELEAEGRYIEKGQSVLEYLKQTAIANPYAKITYVGPNGKTEFPRTIKELPRLPKEIKPHPHGVELGLLRRMVLSTKARNLAGFLVSDFSRVGKGSAEHMCRSAKVDAKKKPQSLNHEEIERLHKAMQAAKLIAPPTDCLSPLGEKLLTEGLKRQTGAEYAVAVTRPPAVYRGNPFQVEVCLAYGGVLQEGSAQLYRLANKVPLLYHQGDCATTEAAVDVDWRRYGFSQSSGALPQGPLAILVHFASVWVPYTSEGKQAIADYPEIIKEMKLALQDAARKLAIYVRQKQRIRDKQMRQNLFEKYIPELSESLSKLSGEKKEKIKAELEKMLNKNSNIIIENGSMEDENESLKGE